VVIRRVRFAGPIITIIGQPSDELSDAAAVTDNPADYALSDSESAGAKGWKSACATT
jgi:hypothetical protein